MSRVIDAYEAPRIVERARIDVPLVLAASGQPVG
jgi:hypothetical protein